MTNEVSVEEAIDVFKIMKRQVLEDSREDKVLDMAIKALEQQPCEDCISREEAIDILYDYEYKKDMRKALMELPSVTPKGVTITDFADRCRECGNIKSSITAKARWIPVSERLPEEDGEYLVCYEEGYRKDYDFDEVGIAPFEVDCEGFGYWQPHYDKSTLGYLDSDWTEISVIAWMPLPEPYKAESEEEE